MSTPTIMKILPWRNKRRKSIILQQSQQSQPQSPSLLTPYQRVNKPTTPTSPLTPTPQQPSFLLILPPEIRLKIYTYVLSSPSTINLSTFNPHHPTYTLFRAHHLRQKDLLRNLTYLPSTCRLIRAETRFLPFELNEFLLVRGLERLKDGQAGRVKRVRWGSGWGCLEGNGGSCEEGGEGDGRYERCGGSVKLVDGAVERCLGFLVKMKALEGLVVHWSEKGPGGKEVWERFRTALGRELRRELEKLGRGDVEVSVVRSVKKERMECDGK